VYAKMRKFSPEIQKSGAYTDMLILCSSQVHERASCCVPLFSRFINIWENCAPHLLLCYALVI